VLHRRPIGYRNITWHRRAGRFAHRPGACRAPLHRRHQAATPWPIDELLEATDSKYRPQSQLGYAAPPRPVAGPHHRAGT